MTARYDTLTTHLLPLPRRAAPRNGSFVVPAITTVWTEGPEDVRVESALTRLQASWTLSGGSDVRIRTSTTNEVHLNLSWDATFASAPKLGEDESYRLEITEGSVSLRAPSSLGVLRGIESLKLLAESGERGLALPCCLVEDAPRFPWRGLMIDVCRHWMPVDVILRNLDAMALVKLNVLHLHLSDDQGFRVECHSFPKLHLHGSDGFYFTHGDLRRIVDYASERGIRVVPEFDIPGHTQSWGVGHPEVMSAPGPYSIQRRWGIFDATLDPTNPRTYEIVGSLFAEMAALFPDEHFHIGGDEVNGHHWDLNPLIQEFIKKQHLKDNAGLQAYFNQQVISLLSKLGKKAVGWDEVLHPRLHDVTVQSWRGVTGVVSAAKAGMKTLLSNGYYLDLMQSAEFHYRHDPVPRDESLTAEQQRLILGGEATMWSEWTSTETVDSRIWPRTAAVAERLWSGIEIQDVDNLYRRFPVVLQQLENLGLKHLTSRKALLEAALGNKTSPAVVDTLLELISHVQPVQVYQRGKCQPDHNQLTVLSGLADCATADAPKARALAMRVQAVTHGSARVSELQPFLNEWRALSNRLTEVAPQVPDWSGDLLHLSSQLDTAGHFLNALMETLKGNQEAPSEASAHQALALVSKPQAAVEFPFAAPLERLWIAARDQKLKVQLSPTAWLEHLKATAKISGPV